MIAPIWIPVNAWPDVSLIVLGVENKPTNNPDTLVQWKFTNCEYFAQLDEAEANEEELHFPTRRVIMLATVRAIAPPEVIHWHTFGQQPPSSALI